MFYFSYVGLYCTVLYMVHLFHLGLSWSIIATTEWYINLPLKCSQVHQRMRKRLEILVFAYSTVKKTKTNIYKNNPCSKIIYLSFVYMWTGHSQSCQLGDFVARFRDIYFHLETISSDLQHGENLEIFTRDFYSFINTRIHINNTVYCIKFSDLYRWI